MFVKKTKVGSAKSMDRLEWMGVNMYMTSLIRGPKVK